MPQYFLTLQRDFKGALILVSTRISCSVGNDSRGVKRVRWSDSSWWYSDLRRLVAVVSSHRKSPVYRCRWIFSDAGEDVGWAAHEYGRRNVCNATYEKIQPFEYFHIRRLEPKYILSSWWLKGGQDLPKHLILEKQHCFIFCFASNRRKSQRNDVPLHCKAEDTFWFQFPFFPHCNTFTPPLLWNPCLHSK